MQKTQYVVVVNGGLEPDIPYEIYATLQAAKEAVKETAGSLSEGDTVEIYVLSPAPAATGTINPGVDWE